MVCIILNVEFCVSPIVVEHAYIQRKTLREISMLADQDQSFTLIFQTSTVGFLSSSLILPSGSCKQGAIAI